MSNVLFARVEPLDPKRGRTTQNVHFAGTLFRGGAQPIWYKVTAELAAKLTQEEQPSGAPMFQVVTEDEKIARDQAEQARRLVAMGMISETIQQTATGRRQEIDLTPATAAPAPAAATGKQPRRPRAGAVPTAEEQSAAAAVAGGGGGGDLTTASLPGASVLSDE